MGPVVGNDLRAMLLHMNFFGPVPVHGEPTAYRQPCEEAYRDFLAWKRAHKIPSSQRKFSYWSVFKEEYGCYMNSKGYNARVLSAWLEDVLERARSTPPLGLINDNRLYTCLVTVSLALTCRVFFSYGGWEAGVFTPVHTALPLSKESNQPVLPTYGDGLEGAVARLIDHLVATPHGLCMACCLMECVLNIDNLHKCFPDYPGVRQRHTI